MAIINWLVQGSIVAIVAAVILRALRDARARSRYVICWVALVAVLALPLAAILQVPVAPAAAFAVEVAAPHPLIAVLIGVLAAIVGAAWVLWTCIRGWQFAAALAALRRARRECRAFPDGLETRLHHWSHLKKRGRSAPLMLSADVRAAAVLSGRHAIIAVAPALIDHLSADELDRLVIHEWAHVQRRDDMAHVLQIVCRILVGWHPAVWWLNQRLHEEREAACDEMAVTLTRSAKAYAASLVKVAALPLPALRPLPAVGALSSPGVTARVRRIVARRRFASRRMSRNAVVSSGILLAVVWFAVTAVRLVEAAATSRFEAAPGAVDLPSRELMLIERSGASGNAAGAAKPAASASGQPGSQAPPRSRQTRDASSDQRERDGRLLTPPPIDAHEASLPAPLPATVVPVLIEPPGVDRPVAGASADAAPQAPPDASSVPPWTAAAAAGRAIGQGSKNAGAATAGFFTRLSKRIAGSF
jgi:bla regulator protein blaR1